MATLNVSQLRQDSKLSTNSGPISLESSSWISILVLFPGNAVKSLYHLVSGKMSHKILFNNRDKEAQDWISGESLWRGYFLVFPGKLQELTLDGINKVSDPFMDENLSHTS